MDYAVDLSRRLKTDASTARVKIVVLLPADAYRQFGGFLRAGAEECFLRPVEPRRYLAGLRRVLGFVRRPKADAEITAERLEYAGLVVDLKSHRIRHGDREIRVGLVEFGLLRQLMDPPGTVFSREQLIKSAWPDGIFVDPRTVNVHIGRLRRRLRDVMSMEVIRTVRGVGYALEITPQPMS
jgi:two-component system phosphate regulon response regulator PhoB